MARRRSSRREGKTVQRDTFDVSSLLLDELVEPLTPLAAPVRPTRLLEIEDRRFWHPDTEPDALRFDGVPARVVEVDEPSVPAHVVLSRSRRTLPRVASVERTRGFYFEDSRHVVECARRQERREVMFALRKTGRGARAPRYRDWRSEVKCR